MRTLQPPRLGTDLNCPAAAESHPLLAYPEAAKGTCNLLFRLYLQVTAPGSLQSEQ